MRKLQDILLYILFFSVNFGMWELADSGMLSVVKFIGVFYMGAVILMPKGFFVLPRKLRPIYLPLVFFLLFITIMNILNINSVSSRWFNPGMYQWILMLLILANHERMRPLTLTRGMLAFSAAAFIIAMLSLFDIGTEISQDGRLSILGENANAMAVRMAIASVILLYNAVYNPLKTGSLRFLLLFAAIPMIIFLIDSGSRIALLSILGMLLAAVFVIRIRNVILRMGYILLVAAVMGMTIYYAVSSDIMSNRLEQSITERHLSGRDVIWAKLLPLIAEHPVVGVGETGYAEYSQYVFGKPVSPHNVFLELMCYTGAIGAIIYLTFIVQMGRGAFITLRRSRNFLPLLLLIPVMGLMISGQALNVKTTWCIYAYIIGTYISIVSPARTAAKKTYAQGPY